MLGVEAEKPSVSAQPTDQERQDRSTAVPGSAEKHAADVKVANLQRPEQEVIRLAIQAPIEGKLQEVEFDFNLEHDRPEQVSAEIINELNLPNDEQNQMSRVIANLADDARRRIRATSSDLGDVISETNSSDGETPRSGLDYPESVVVEPEVVHSARTHDKARVERSGCSDGATAHASGSPTSGPGSDAQDPSPQEPADRLTEVAPRGPRIDLRDKDDDSCESSNEEGGLLGLLLHDDDGGGVGGGVGGGGLNRAVRKGRENLRATSSAPPERSRNDGDDESPRQQTPRQGTAEVPPGVTPWTSRTGPIPVSDIDAASPPVVTDGPARSFASATPSSSLRDEDPATIPTAAAEQLHVSFRPPKSPAPRPPVVTKEFDSSFSESCSLAAEPITSSEVLSTRGVSSSPRVRTRAAAGSARSKRGNSEDSPVAAAAAAAAAAATAAAAAAAASVAAAAAGGVPCAQQEEAAPEPFGAVRAAAATPVSKPLSLSLSLPPARRGRSQHAFHLGTPRERGSARKPSTPKEQGTPRNRPQTPVRVTAGVPPSEKGGVTPVRPVVAEYCCVDMAMSSSSLSASGDCQRDSHQERGIAKVTKTERKGGGQGEGGGGNSALPDEDQDTGTWFEHRTHGRSTSAQRDSFRRRGSQRLSRSSSWDDASIGSFHGQQTIFSPGRFNPTSSALSWESVDDSVCGSSARSFDSLKGPSGRMFSVPELSESEKEAVEQLKINRSDINFGYNTLEGSKRVYKIELNGQMRAAKVINTLGMSRDELAEMWETFDTELLALSRLDNPHVVKVCGASVSPTDVMVVSELVEGGVLRNLLHDPRKLKSLTLRMRLGIAEDIALGMKSLYSHGMQHRHLTSHSILLTSDYRAKILGVGLSRTTELIGFFEGEERADQQAEEELPWTSREVLAGAGFSQKSDVYSFGIILWELLQKEPCLPYAGLVPSEVVGAKYSGEGLPIPEDCPVAIARLMKSCWSNLPPNRPSFDKICDILEVAQGLQEKVNAADPATPLGHQGGMPGAIVPPLQEVEEPHLEDDESVGSSDSGSSGGETPSDMSDSASNVSATPRFFPGDELPAAPPAATPAPTPAATPPSATPAANQDQDHDHDHDHDRTVGFPIAVVPKQPKSGAVVKVPSRWAGESSNSLNDRTAVRIDAAIHAALDIAGTSSNFDVPRPPEMSYAGRGGGGRGGEGERYLALHHGSGSDGSLGSSSETSTKFRALVPMEPKKNTSEARLDAAIQAALLMHATDGGSSRFQGPFNGGYEAPPLPYTPRRAGRGGMGPLDPPPAPPRLRDRRFRSPESSSGYDADNSGGGGGAGSMWLPGNSGPAPGRAWGSRLEMGVIARVHRVLQAVVSAREAEIHQADEAAARLQRLQEQQRDRRRKGQEYGSGGGRPYGPQQPGAVGSSETEEQRKNYTRRVAGDARARGPARARAETRATATDTFAHERVFQGERVLVAAYPDPAAAKVGLQGSAMQGPAGRSVTFAPTDAECRVVGRFCALELIAPLKPIEEHYVIGPDDRGLPVDKPWRGARCYWFFRRSSASPVYLLAFRSWDIVVGDRDDVTPCGSILVGTTVVTARAARALSYGREVLATAATLFQEVPVAGEVCATFLAFEELVETAISNKEDLAVLRELCDVVIKSVAARTAKLDDMVARLAHQEEDKPSSAQVAGAPSIRDWYVEREKVMSRACDRLAVGISPDGFKEPRMVGLAGPGGTGKSTVASMVVARGDVRASFKNGVLWLPVGKAAKNRLSALMFNLAEKVFNTVMGKTCRAPRKANVLLNNEDGAAYIREVVDDNSRRFLVVADDVWEEEVLRELERAGVWVLYTTREDNLLPEDPPLRVDEVLEEEAEMVLRGAAELDDYTARLPEAAYELMRRCEYSMLDLVLVGRWSDVRRRSDKQAWQKALRRIVEAQKGGEGAKLRPWRAAVLRAGLKELASDNAQNKELYLALAILPTGMAFPLEVGACLLYGNNCSTEDKKATEQVLETLERWSIVTLEVDGEYRVHEDHVDFVWDCLLANRDTQDRVLPRWREYISSVQALNTYTSGWLVKIWRVLAKVEGGRVVPSPYDKVLDAMDPSSAGLPGALKKVAEFHYERQDWSDAYDKYSRLRKIGEAASGGDDSLDVANTLHSLGMCANEMVGREEETERLLRRALEIQKEELGPDHPDVANTLHSLGVCIREAGNTDEAEDLLRQALAIRKEKGNDPLSLAHIQYSLGVCVYKTGRLQEAEEDLLKEALAIRKEWLGHDHPEVANALYYLGLCDHKAGRTGEGERKLFRALKIFELKIGHDHQDVADTLFSLGKCALEGGERTSEAEAYYRRALAIREKQATNQAQVAETLHALGVCASKAGNDEEAQHFFRRANGLLKEQSVAAFRFEAAVYGGIEKPQETSKGSKTRKVSGFMESTTSLMYFFKTRSEGANFGELLKEARDLGHAEKDLQQLLQELAAGTTVSSGSIQCKGVFSPLSTVDFEYTKILRLTIKLQGTAKLSPDGETLSVFVSPVLVTPTSPVASTEGPGNIVSIDSKKWELDSDATARFYLHICCQDDLGIIKRMGELAVENEVSIHAILQTPIEDVAKADFVITTHPCK
eukprot:g13850.t1